MNTQLPGVGGSLFPGQYLAERVARDAFDESAGLHLESQRRAIMAWWTRVERTCGPVTGLRTLFDVAAMPLFAALGYRARDVVFDRTVARVHLTSPGDTPMGLVLRPWASRPSTMWREVVAGARAIDADWGFVLAPPYLSLINARGHTIRRGLDVTFPDVLDTRAFSVFWTIANAGAFDSAAHPQPGESGATAAIDRLVLAASQFEDRVRRDLQTGVIEALHALAQVLRASPDARDADGRFQEALTIVYRVLFLLFAESRDLVPHHHPIYRQAYTVSALCRESLDAAPVAGLWAALAAITRLSRTGCRADDLMVRPFNGRLFSRRAAPSLEARRIASGPTRESLARDGALQRALVALATRPGRAGREPIRYADLGVEQLGAVYEHVLDLEPERLGASNSGSQARDPVSVSRAAHGHSARRKESGTFYTPQSLSEFVVRRTLAPLVAGASTDAILALRVVDPAMGSGAFLVAACRYLAAAYEHALVEEGRAAPADVDEAARANIRRLVAERCLAGVDANPVAVQLARLSLWLATLADGKPLGFLDHRLRSGNSLIGASPDDLRRVPDRPGAAGRPASLPLFDESRLEDAVLRIARPLVDLSARRDDTVEDVHAKEAAWAAIAGARSPLGPWRRAASLWCARWFMEGRSSPAEIRAAIDAVLRGDPTLGASRLAQMLAETAALETRHGFFHWPLEFADVFYDERGRAKDHPGFDAVIGNPPWEMLRAVAGASDLVRFIRDSGLYPSCGRGHVNLYQPFLDRALALTRTGGRVGLVLPWGLAVDDGAAGLRATLLDRSGIDAVVGLDNGDGLFPIHRGLRFLTLTTTVGRRTEEIRACFGVRTAAELAALPGGDDEGDARSRWPVRLTPRQIRAIGGPARRIPDVRRPGDLELIERLVHEHPSLGSPHGWAVRFSRELNASEDRDSFGTRGWPVIDGKHVRPFVVDARTSRRRIDTGTANRLLPDGRHERARLAYRDVSGVGNRVSLIAAIVPAGVVTTHTLFCLRSPVSIEQQHFLCGVFNSYVLNALARMLMGGHLTTSLVEDFPVPVWRGSAGERRIARLSRRLADWSPAAVTSLRTARLQAAVARLYGLDERAFRQVLEGFPLVADAERRLALECLWRPGRRDAL